MPAELRHEWEGLTPEEQEAHLERLRFRLVVDPDRSWLTELQRPGETAVDEHAYEGSGTVRAC